VLSFLFPWTISSITFPCPLGEHRGPSPPAGIYGRPPASPNRTLLSFAGLLLGEGESLVPKKGDDELLRFMESCETVSLAVQNQALIAKAGNKTLTIRLLDKRFPEYRRIIPPWFTVKWTFKPGRNVPDPQAFWPW